MKGKRLFSILLVIVTFACTGCSDAQEIKEQGYVAAIGIDKGKNDNLSITFQITNVRYGGAGKGTSGATEKRSETVTFESPDLITAVNLANTTVSRNISIAHTRILIVGEEFARDKEFFRQLEAALREKEFRRGINILISREKASDFITGNAPILETRISKYFDFMYDRWQSTGMVPESDLNKFMQRTESGKSLFLAVYISAKKDNPIYTGNEASYLPGQVDIEGGNSTQVIGAAVFKDGVMIGRINGDENRINVLLRPTVNVKDMLFTFKDPLNPKYKISVRTIRTEKNKYKVHLNGYAPKLEVTIPLYVDVLAIPSFVKYVEDPKKHETLKKSIEEQLEIKANNLIEKTKDEFGGEPFLWGERVIRKKFLTYDEYKAYNWMDKYKDSTIDVKFEIKIRSFGKQMNPPDVSQNKQ